MDLRTTSPVVPTESFFGGHSGGHKPPLQTAPSRRGSMADKIEYTCKGICSCKHAAREAARHLPLPLRRNAPAHSPFALGPAPLCLPPSGNPGAAAGQNFETSRLPQGPGNGGKPPPPKLDALQPAPDQRPRTRSQPPLPPGLHGHRTRFQARPETPGET